MYPSVIEQVHIELTDKCQASCPMCLRNYYGSVEREFIKNVEITLDDIKKWFPIPFIQNLKRLYACGSLGDPVIAKDCLEIFNYLRTHNPTCRLEINTNGSLKSREWWRSLATVLGENGVVVFGIDGFKHEHEKYRRGTDWDKIIKNAKEFIAAGGQAQADCLVFKHNEERIEELKAFLYSIGFKDVFLRITPRFYSNSDWPVYDRQGNFEYNISKPTGSNWAPKFFQPNIKELANEPKFREIISLAQIEPKCASMKEIYIDARGQVFPCCWCASIVAPDLETSDPDLKFLKNKLRKSTEDLVSNIGILNLHNATNIEDLLNQSQWEEKLPNHWNNDKKFICVKQCANNLKDIIK